MNRSNLTYVEKSKFETLLGMESGYVLDFTNRSFAEFVRDSTGRDIYDLRYNYGSGSKANQLRAFWQKEDEWEDAYLPVNEEVLTELNVP